MMPTIPVIRRICAAAASLAVIGAVAGCGQDSAENQPPTVVTNNTTTPVPVPVATSTTVTTAPGTTTTVGGVPQTNNTNAGPGGATGADSVTGDAVLKAIHTNVQLTGSRILATADAAGVVRLTGTAQNQQQKALAERLARNTSGVTSVINKIEIVATGGAKSPPPPAKVKVIEKTKIVVIHDKSTPAPTTNSAAPATPSDTGAGSASDSSSPTTAPPPAPSGQ